jgi:hypothetical protein
VPDTRSVPAGCAPGAASTSLGRLGLQVDLHVGDESFLRVHSTIDPRQDVLLPVWPGPVLAGLSGCTRLGRLSGLCWAFACGSGPLAGDVRVEFASDRVRFRQLVDAAVHELSEDCWFAAVEGVLDSVALVAAEDVALTRVPLARRW